MLKFLHTADLHLDRPFKGLREVPETILERIKNSTFNTLKNIINLAIDEKVDFIIISGDLYDGDMRSLFAQTRLRDQLNRLRTYDIPVYITHGNHDHLSGDWARIEWEDHVHFFGKDVEMKVFDKGGEPLAHLYGFSYGRRQVVENMTSYYEKQHGAPFHIGILHGFYQEGSGHDVYAPFSLDELLSKEFDYWALGHIHKRQKLSDDPPIWYPGTPQGLSIKETGVKGCAIVECYPNNKAQVTFKSTDDVRWMEKSISIEEMRTVDDLLQTIDQLKDHLRSKEKCVLLRIIVRGQGVLHSTLTDDSSKQEIEQLIRQSEDSFHHFVWLIDLKVETTPPWNRKQLKEGHYFISDLLNLIDRTADIQSFISPLYDHRRAKRYLDKLTTEEQQSILQEAESLLIKSLLFEGSESLED